MKKGFYLEAWQKKQLRDFFKMAVSAPNDYGEMKMPAHMWQDLDEHCKKEMEKLEIVMKKGVKERLCVPASVRGYWLYYKELGRICALKLEIWKKCKGWILFCACNGERPKDKVRESAERMEKLKRVTALCEQRIKED